MNEQQVIKFQILNGFGRIFREWMNSELTDKKFVGEFRDMMQQRRLDLEREIERTKIIDLEKLLDCPKCKSENCVKIITDRGKEKLYCSSCQRTWPKGKS